MQLYILRHGDAERIASSDRERQLTDRGKQQVHAVVQRHQQEIAKVTSIFVSPFRRAQETAAIVSQHFPTVPLHTAEMLTPDHSPMDVVRFLCQQPESAKILLVSHQPLVSELVSELCNQVPAAVGMHTAALAGILLNPVAIGMGKLQFLDS